MGVASVLIVWKVGFDLPAPQEPNELAGVVRESNQPAAPNQPIVAERPAGPNQPVVAVEPEDVSGFVLMPDGNAVFAGVVARTGPADGNMAAVDANAPVLADANDMDDETALADANDADGEITVADANAPGGRRVVARAGRGARSTEPNEPLESLNLKTVEMRQVIDKLAAWTGKVVIPHDQAMSQRLTIYSPDRLPRSEALEHIYGALRMRGFVAEHTEKAIYLKPIADAKLGQVPTVAADQPLATFENKDQVVQKFFTLKSYSPAQMAQVISPLVGDYGYVSADEVARSLLVIDTVSNLMRIESIIGQFDVPESEQAVTKIVNVRVGDPTEIVQMLRMLIGETQGLGTARSTVTSTQQRSRTTTSGGSGTSSSVVVGTARGPVVLIPELRRRWIIVRAAADDMVKIEEWIERLDMDEVVSSEYEVVRLRYADPREVQDSMGDGFRRVPGMEFLPNILIEPLYNTRSVLVFGRADLREIVKNMIQEIDVPPGEYLTEHIRLKYSDPDRIKEKLDELYSELTGTSRTGMGGYNPFASYGGAGGRGRTSTASDMVRVISYVSLKEVCVIASPENMREIKMRIEEWDKPLDVEAVKPRIVELQNSDPTQMAQLLNTLFSETSATGARSTTQRNAFLPAFFGNTTADREKIIGPLYGQLTFNEVPGTRKIIVISKIPEAYDVVEQLVLELDREEMGEIPTLITLKYADPEDLAERMNAMFSEAGTTATYRMTSSGLSAYSMESTNTATTIGTTTATNQVRPPWSNTGARSTLDTQRPISNVIGRVRFVPEPRTKSIMVLSPPQFITKIRELIDLLDVPGKQVVVKAIILQVNHEKMTSLGTQFASNPEAFGVLGVNAIQAVNTLQQLSTNGSIRFPSATGQPAWTNNAAGSGSDFGFNVAGSVYVLIDFLVKHMNAKVLNEQTLWTKDNEEAMFFKGEKIAFVTDTSVSGTTGLATTSFEFERVGMTLQVRPSITPENNVDMIVRVQISDLTADMVNAQPVRTEMDTTTNMIVEDGSTLLLGGILIQKDSQIRRKVAGLGDLPGVGELFRHNAIRESNEELMVFITPFVVDDPNGTQAATKAQIDEARQKHEDFRRSLDDTVEQLRQEVMKMEK